MNKIFVYTLYLLAIINVFSLYADFTNFPQLYQIGSLGTITNTTNQIFYLDKNSSISLQQNFPINFSTNYPDYFFSDWGTYKSDTNRFEISFSSSDNLTKILVDIQPAPASLDIYGKVTVAGSDIIIPGKTILGTDSLQNAIENKLVSQSSDWLKQQLPANQVITTLATGPFTFFDANNKQITISDNIDQIAQCISNLWKEEFIKSGKWLLNFSITQQQNDAVPQIQIDSITASLDASATCNYPFKIMVYGALLASQNYDFPYHIIQNITLSLQDLQNAGVQIIDKAKQ